MTVHLLRMAVGVESLAHLKQIQSERLRQTEGRNENGLYTFTRNFPKQVDDLIDGGSVYWVVKRFIRVRQEILGIEKRENDEGKSFCAIRIDPVLKRVVARRQKAFQGWRYLRPKDIPEDLQSSTFAANEMPSEMADELRELGLI